MQKLLIADESAEFAADLQQRCSSDFQTAICCSGIDARQMLRSDPPDACIIDLMLPQIDGITLLSDPQTPVPPIILATTRMISNYIVQAAKDAGVSYLIRKPCSPDAICKRMKDMIRRASAPQKPDSQELSAQILRELSFSPKLDGYRQLKIGIPLFAQDPGISLSKELYPAIAELTGADDWRKIERSVRIAIRKTWERNHNQLWQIYFPQSSETCPSNKLFMVRLAEIITIRSRNFE